MISIQLRPLEAPPAGKSRGAQRPGAPAKGKSYAWSLLASCSAGDPAADVEHLAIRIANGSSNCGWRVALIGLVREVPSLCDLIRPDVEAIDHQPTARHLRNGLVAIPDDDRRDEARMICDYDAVLSEVSQAQRTWAMGAHTTQ